MEKHLIDWTIAVLGEAADTFGNRGCNDYDWPDDWTDDQKRSFILARYVRNSATTLDGGPELEELTDDLASLRCPPDFVCASTLAYLLKQETAPGAPEDARAELEAATAERDAVIAAMGGFYGATGGKSLPEKIAILSKFAQRKCLERMEANTARYAAEATLDRVRAVASGMQDGPSGVPEIDTMRAEVVRLRAEATERHGKLRNVKAALAGVLDEFGSFESADDVPSPADNGYMPAHQWGHDRGRAALADLRQQLDDTHLAIAMVLGKGWPSGWHWGFPDCMKSPCGKYSIKQHKTHWSLMVEDRSSGSWKGSVTEHPDPLAALRACQAAAAG